MLPRGPGEGTKAAQQNTVGSAGPEGRGCQMTARRSTGLALGALGRAPDHTWRGAFRRDIIPSRKDSGCWEIWEYVLEKGPACSEA